MNAKLAKELRRFVREAQKEGTPTARLLAKPVKLKSGGQAIVAINSRQSARGAYLHLKAVVTEHPEVLEQLRATAAYKKMVKAQQASGGPLYEHRTYGTESDSPAVEEALKRSMRQTT